jgi:hypothetical protein
MKAMRSSGTENYAEERRRSCSSDTRASRLPITIAKNRIEDASGCATAASCPAILLSHESYRPKESL